MTQAMKEMNSDEIENNLGITLLTEWLEKAPEEERLELRWEKWEENESNMWVLGRRKILVEGIKMQMIGPQQEHSLSQAQKCQRDRGESIRRG